MKQVMLSLDKNILNKDSRVAKRMIEYGKTDELFIVVPDKQAKHFDLSPTVHVRSTGGSKMHQFFRLKKFGRLAIEKGGAECITTQDPFFLGLIGAWLKNKTGKKLEVQLHGDFFSSDYYRTSGRKHWLQYYIGKRVIKKADTLRVVGERIRQSLIHRGVDDSKIEVRPIIVDREKIQKYQPKIDVHQKYPECKKIYLVLGRLEQIKNVSFLIELWKDMPATHLLLIVGQGSQEAKLKQQAKGAKNIVFESWTKDPYSYFKIADCLLFPSLSEGYGLVAMEANAAGTPVIMNDVGVGNYELLPSEQVVILPTNDSEAWMQSILEL